MVKTINLTLSVILLSETQSPDLITVTQASLARQTLASEDFEIIIDIKDNLSYAGLLQSMLARARGKYIFIINAGDKIDREYLKKSVLVLQSNDRIGFTYARIKKFGLSEISIMPEAFDAKKFFINNLVLGAVYRGCAVKRIVKSLDQLNDCFKEGVRHYLTIKVMAQGYWGNPIDDVVYYLLTDFKVNNFSRSILNCETLKVLSLRWLDFLLIQKTQKEYLKFMSHGGDNDVGFPRPVERSLGFIFSRLFSFKIKYFSLRAILNFLFCWKVFKEDFLKKSCILSEAELLCGFQEKPDYGRLKAGPKESLKDTIIFAHDAWVLGGGEKVLLKWIQSIVSDGKIKAIDIGTKSSGECAFMRDDFRKFAIEQYPLDRLSQTPKELLRLCWEFIIVERPKVLFIMSNAYFYALAPYIKKHYPQIVIVDLLHNEYADDPGWFSIANEYKEYMDHRMVISETWKNVLIGKYGERTEKIVVCENGVDLDIFDPGKYDKKELKTQYALSPNKKVVAFIGRINRQKKPEVFLKLAKSLISDARFEFIFIGNKDDVFEYVQEIEAKMSMLPNVRYFGHSDNVPQFMAVTDVLILPSKFEGDPLISLEAAAMNVPIIATDIVGFRQQVNEGKFGILYGQNTDDQDVKVIKDILLNRQGDLKDCASRGRVFASKSRDIRKKEMVYKRILSSLLESN